MTEPTRNDILDQYRNILNKLKKRFLRKPNVTEACESFTSLALQCEDTELPPYAGLCWIAAARCEGSLGNSPGEISCLVRSARQFLSAELNDKDLGCVSPSCENLQAALSCYTHAFSRMPAGSPTAIGLNLEIVESLSKLDEIESKEIYLRNAANLAENSVDSRVLCLEMLVSNYVEKCDYTAALETLTEVVYLLEICPRNGARCDLLLKCEISRVLLLLILRPTPQRLAPHLAQLLEKYAWGESKEKSLIACGMSEKLFLLMQSLVMICQSSDTSGLPDIEGRFWSYLTKEQKDLLRTLVRIYLRL